MAKTLVDEPPPSTLNEPPAGDRPTLDDIPAENRPTLDDIPGVRRGPSPTLVDPPPPAAAPRRGSPPTLADGPPLASRTPAAAPLHVQPATPPAGPVAAGTPGPTGPQPRTPQPSFATTAESATGPAPQPAAPQAAPQPAVLPVPPAPALPAAPAPLAALPAAPAPVAALPAPPPPLAHPGGAGNPPGLLAQLPAMPAARAPLVPPLAAHGPTPVATGPHPTPTPDAVPVPPPVAAPTPFAGPAPVAAPAAPMAPPVLREHMASPEPVHPPDAPPPAAPQQAPSPQPASPQQAPSPQAGAPRVAAGGRTLLGVAPPPATHAAAPPGQSAQSASYPSAAAGQFLPPGHTSSPDPLSATEPARKGLVPPAPGDAPPGPDAAPPGASAAPGDTPAPTNTPAPAPRKSSARTWIAAAVAVLGLLAIVGVVAGYFLFFRYTPLAERHIPAASNVAFRADLRQIGTFAPVRKHLWPLLLDRPSQKTQGKTLADKVAEETGIHPALDVREVIIASVDSRSWVALIGGNLEPGTFVSGMEKVLRDEGYPGWQRSGDLLVGPAGIALGQAEDGTLVVGTEAEIVTSALPASEEHHRMNLPTNGALSFAVTKEAWEELSREAGAFDAGGSLRRIRHVRGTLSLGDEPAIDIDVEPKGGENAEALGRDVETLLAALRLGLVLTQDRMGEKAALSSAKVAVEQEHVRIRAAWPLEGLDRACAQLAERLK
jgi:hypothetical protein